MVDELLDLLVENERYLYIEINIENLEEKLKEYDRNIDLY